MVSKTVDCLVGLNWGSEGKGRVSAYLAYEYNAMVRSGGPQAGHSFFHEKIKYVNRQIPCGVVNPDCLLFLSASSLLNLGVLANEIRTYHLHPDRLMIDNNAMVVTNKHIGMEKRASLRKKLASTVEGAGAAQAEKIWRRGVLFDHYAFEDPELYFFSNDTANAINKLIDNGYFILLEGTQGFGLCLNHGIYYPFVTSRDVLSSSLFSDAGISPKFHNKTIGVMRTYPIRVAGNSGPTESEEITWEEIAKRSGSPKPIKEYTSVTGRLRRVFEQSYESLEKSILLNRPDQIALMFLDYINYEDYGKSCFETLSKKSRRYIDSLEQRINVPITLIGTGPEENHIIDRRTEEQKNHVFEHPFCKESIKELFPDNIYGNEWGDSFIEKFIDKKMTDKKGNAWKRKIFV
jgi:adenylosuccinate synthase